MKIIFLILLTLLMSACGRIPCELDSGTRVYIYFSGDSTFLPKTQNEAVNMCADLKNKFKEEK